jgi:hypothetical protein
VSQSELLQVLGGFIQQYGLKAGETGPEMFVREVFKAEPDPWQERLCRAIGRGERRITVRACHGPGKTAAAVWIAWWQLLTVFPQKTVVTAPSKGQLEDALLAEMMFWYARLPAVLQSLYKPSAAGIVLIASPKESFFSARTARAETPEALQGVHSDTGRVLLIADEASGVHEKVFESAIGSMSGHNATTMLLSNPTRASGFFYNSHLPGAGWFQIHVSHEDSPRVSDEFVKEVAEAYGEDSAAYRVRALGEFPKADDDTVIPFDLVHSARHRDVVARPGLEVVWGVDVARFGDDDNALVKRTARAVLPDIQLWQGVDLMATAGRVKAEWDRTPASERPTDILVDVIGYGAGVVDRLIELKLPARGINVSETAAMNEQYRNLRTELWFKARDWLHARDVTLPSKEGDPKAPAERLAAELVSPKYAYTSSGKMLVE